MKREPIITICLLLALANVSFVQAQDTLTIRQATAEFKYTQDVYKNVAGLSYTMRYTYANESTPQALLDSLFGRITVSGRKYRCVLDSTETISNDHYSVMLFKKERLMYLARPSRNQAVFDASALLDSTLTSIPGLRCSIDRQHASRMLTLLFPKGMKYKEIRFITDTATGYITEVRYIVRTEQLLGRQAAITGAVSGYDEYGIVDMQLSGYRKEPVDASVFDENTFFHKEGKEYKTAAAYKEYKIFLGTPNL